MCTDSRRIIQNLASTKDWGLCVFFSVDLEGATAYKTAYKIETQAQTVDEDWCDVFEAFYKSFPKKFLQSYVSSPRHETIKDVETPATPSLWKYAGDEILFFSPLSDSRQILEHVHRFGQAIVNYNIILSKKTSKRKTGVRCKGTMWLAGFPINNRIVEIQPIGMESSESIIDFIGPSIDCGFRLSKWASPRRLVIGLDLLWMFVAAQQKCNEVKDYGWITFRYLGERELKGVFSGKPYPIFWCDLHSSETEEEDKWNQLPPVCTNSAIISFCEKINNKTIDCDFIKPFIVKDPSMLFCEVPCEFTDQRNVLMDYNKTAQKDRTDSEKQSNSLDEDSKVIDRVHKVFESVKDN